MICAMHLKIMRMKGKLIARDDVNYELSLVVIVLKQPDENRILTVAYGPATDSSSVRHMNCCVCVALKYIREETKNLSIYSVHNINTNYVACCGL